MERNLDVLVVDDEQIVLDSIKRHLRKLPCTVHTAKSGPEAMEVLQAQRIDMILTDLMMPEIDGLQLMRLVKDKEPKIPIIMITGYATINTALQATQLGAFDYIAKPFTKSELLSVIERAMDLIHAADHGGNDLAEAETVFEHEHDLKSVGDNCWMMVEEDGAVLLGVERAFLTAIGKIQNVYLPEPGDELRQGGVFLQIMSKDLRSHTVVSPLTGTVLSVNRRVLEQPMETLTDPYGKGWMLRIKPSRFDIEVKALGL